MSSKLRIAPRGTPQQPDPPAAPPLLTLDQLEVLSSTREPRPMSARRCAKVNPADGESV
jgi:hypothetical protein